MKNAGDSRGENQDCKLLGPLGDLRAWFGIPAAHQTSVRPDDFPDGGH